MLNIIGRCIINIYFRILAFIFLPTLTTLTHAENHDGGKAACDAGDFKACYDGGVNMMMVQANDIALGLFIKSCEGGIGEGCHFAGRFYDTGTAVKEDTAKALEYFEKACLAGRAGNACYWAADMHKAGETVEINEEKATEFYALGCESEKLEDCEQRAEKYVKGQEEFSKYYKEYKDTVESMNARSKRHCRTIFWPC